MTYECYTKPKPVSEPFFFHFDTNNAAEQLSQATEPNLTNQNVYSCVE